MKIYQPVLFVGLGGTGCLVGAELERRLREELCGPDGGALMNMDQKARFQLPDCLQFVYADFSESELLRLPHLRVPPLLRPAFGRTSRTTHDLLPQARSSTEVTQMLRLAMPGEVESWLPPRQGEPRVTPLHNGAGQLPTVGRAALFATLRHNLEPVLEPLRQAIDVIAKSAGDLRQLGGGRIHGCDVFVAFSVAGGTGAGIFYDYLHLIGEAFRTARLSAKIYPLVVMPSAFPLGKGGGRAAQLNAGRAVIDLFRLIDDQNVPEVSYELGQPGEDGPITVRYPQERRISLQAGVVQTAFLFNKTAGIRQDDLRRSIVSLVLSLIGTELTPPAGGRGEDAEQAVGRGEDDQHQSFADSFINKITERATRSPSGIGRRGVSTSLVASVTVPVNELAELLAARLLATAVRRLTDPSRLGREDNAGLVRRMFAESGIEPVWIREALPLPSDPQPPPKGGTAILTELAGRVDEMNQLLGELDRKVGRDSAELARRFNPRQALLALLKDEDLFRLDRVVNGRREEQQRDGGGGREDPVTREGFTGMLNNRRNQPARPDKVDSEPPRPTHIRGRLLGAVRAKWGDPEVVEALEDQDSWYRWQARRMWHRQWNDQEPRWRPALEAVVRELAEIVEAFRLHAARESDLFLERTRELYRDRTGVSYLLPPQGNLKYFYDDAMDRLVKHAGLPDNEDEAGLVLRLVEHRHWQQAYTLGAREPAEAVAFVKGILEEQIKRLFTELGTNGERPLLPSLADLLAGAAGDERAAREVGKQARELFSKQLANLLPGGFTPQGTGPLQILISYPKTQADEKAREFLRRELQLPHTGGRDPIEFQPVSTLNSITVVLFRTNMSLSEVPEVREVLEQWARALRNGSEEDFLAWRQRTGWEDDWLASSREDREHILHRLLCAMWNGHLDVVGEPASPTQIRLRLPGQGRAVATLGLRTHSRELSSWASILHAYETWALLSPQQATDEFTRQLMEARPGGQDRPPGPPSQLYHRFVHDFAPAQARLIDELSYEHGEQAESWLGPLREFWERTVPAALTLPFPHGNKTVQNLAELEESMRGRAGAAGPGSPDRPVDAVGRTRARGRRENGTTPQQPAAPPAQFERGAGAWDDEREAEQK